MPPVYAPQAPIAGAAASSYQLAVAAREAENARRAAASGGGGYNIDLATLARLNSADADRMQAAISNRDRQQEDSYRFAATQGVSQRDVYMQQMESAQQRERFAMQANLITHELSQQDKMRLARLKNARGAIENDPTLTAEEKEQYKTMLESGINPLEMRLAKQRADSQEMANKALADQRESNARLNEAEMKLNAMSFRDRTHYYVEPGILNQITEDLKANWPGASMLPFNSLQNLAEQIAQQQGLGIAMYQSQPGKWEALTGGKTGDSKGKGATDHPSGMTMEQFLRLEEDAMKEAQTMQKQTDAEGRNLHPQTAEWLEERSRQIMERKMKSAQTYAATAKPRGYQSVAKQPVAVTANPTLSNFATQKIESLGVEAQRLANREDIAPDLKFQVMERLQRARLIMRDNPDPQRMPAHLRKELEETMKLYESLPRDPSVTTQPEKPAAKSAPAGAPAKRNLPAKAQ